MHKERRRKLKPPNRYVQRALFAPIQHVLATAAAEDAIYSSRSLQSILILFFFFFDKQKPALDVATLAPAEEVIADAQPSHTLMQNLKPPVKVLAGTPITWVNSDRKFVTAMC